MPNLKDRPFIGTWKPNNRKVVKYTPDCMVYLNGDISLPGCPTCRGKIDINQYVKGLSIEASTQPGGHSANFQLSIPKVFGESLFVDGNFLLRPTLEVHIYMKGYFPVKGMFDHLPEDVTTTSSNTENAVSFQGNALGGVLDEVTSIKGMPDYPYYHCFHGVVTQVNSDYSDGFYTASVSCASMLHFWQHQTVSTNGSLFGARPRNSNVRMGMRGHNLSGMTPYGIIYMLYKDTVGAAQGVGSALSKTTNLDATSQVTGKSLYSMAILYWERRFRQSIYSLRMHGTSGKLFNGAQQAYLGGVRTQDKNKNLKATNFSDGSRVHRSVDPFGNYLTKEKELRELGQKERRGLVASLLFQGGNDLTFSSMASESGYGVNILDAQAFVSDVSNWGNVNLWESEYETKMDIAQKVMEITGFEFYQDVDGDLVFKPPFFNLDTEPSRIYRIEDIDIISINMIEKEPSATMITLKGSGMKNIVSTGLDNHLGRIGQYIDYRLVAQFGWRPHNRDVHYFSSQRAMFYGAVNMLDLLNIDVKSASVTIPIRPELRPGYPVFIPSIDSYYYITAFTHSFQFGGACTTSLVLTARRSKFYAPGERGVKTSVSAIKLDNPFLPPTPLQVLDGNGIPRLTGFPNVVMALDPNKTNPRFSILRKISVGYFNSSTSEAVVNQLIEDFFQSGIEVLGIDGDVADSQNARFSGPWFIQQDGDTKIKVTRQDFTATFNQEFQRLKKLQNTKSSAEALILELRDLGKITDKVLRKQQRIISGATESITRSFSKNDASAVNVIIAFNNAQFSNNDLAGRSNLDGVKDPNSVASYLDLLADRKANFVSDSYPGYYRYYSASHPDYQGMSKMSEKDPLSDEEQVNISEGDLAALERPYIVQGFVPVPGAPTSSGAQPQVEWGDVEVTSGILLAKPRGGVAEVTPTHLIQTIAFSLVVTDKQTSIPGVTLSGDFDMSVSFERLIQRLLKKRIVATVREITPNVGELLGKTLQETFLDVVSTLNVVLKDNFVDFRIKQDSGEFVTSTVALGVATNFWELDDFNFPLGSSPKNKFAPRGVLPNKEFEPVEGKGQDLIKTTVLEAISLRKKSGLKVDRGKTYFTFGTNGRKKNRVKGAPLTSISSGDLRVMREIATHYSAPLIKNIRAVINKVFKESIEEDKGKLSRFFNDVLNELSGTPLNVVKKNSKGRMRVNSKALKRFRRTTARPTPVYPVSDARGYEVYGSYRYGRGLDIAPGGLMQQIYEQGNVLIDPFGGSNALTSALFLDALSSQEVLERSLEIRGEDVLFKSGTDREKKFSTFRAASAAVLEHLRKKAKDDPTKKITLENYVSPNPSDVEGIEALENVDIGPDQKAWTNYFANTVLTGSDSNFKIPVVNNAYLISDISSDLELNQRRTCSCRLAEADLYLEAFGSESFIPLEGGNAEDVVVEFERQQMLLQTQAYLNNKAALRGNNQDNPFDDFKEAWDRLLAAGENASSVLTQQVEQSKISFDNARNRFNAKSSDLGPQE